MLRIIVISLFVANLFLIGFQLSNPVENKPVASPSVVHQEVDLPTIHLFSELMDDEDLMTGNRQCFSLGPFHELAGAQALRGRLEPVSLAVNQRETRAQLDRGYWVFMPPYDSLLEANRALLSLQALGLEDIAIVYDGDWQYAISMGYFLRLKNARRRMEGLQSRGYTPLMRVHRDDEPRYWLDYEQNPGSELFVLDFSDHPNDFMQRSMPCPENAPLEAGNELLQPVAAVENQPQTESDPNTTPNDTDDG